MEMTKNQRTSDDEIFYWYEQLQKFKSQYLPPKQFCEEYGLHYKTFVNKRHRIDFMQGSKKELYQETKILFDEYKKSKLSLNNFSELKNIDGRRLKEFATHYNYLQAIERVKKSKEKTGMTFIEIPRTNLAEAIPRPPIEIDKIEAPQVLLEKQNDIELNITKGVKVLISPNVDSMKIIKIIELLKDL